jgi:hypothetical protein
MQEDLVWSSSRDDRHGRNLPRPGSRGGITIAGWGFSRLSGEES